MSPGELEKYSVDELKGMLRDGIAEKLSRDFIDELVMDMRSKLNEEKPRKIEEKLGIVQEVEVADDNPVLSGLKAMFAPPKQRIRLGNKLMQQQPYFCREALTIHPVSLGANYKQTRAAFYFNQNLHKYEKNQRNAGPLRSSSVPIPYFPPDPVKKASFSKASTLMKQVPEISSSNIPMSPYCSEGEEDV